MSGIPLHLLLILKKRSEDRRNLLSGMLVKFMLCVAFCKLSYCVNSFFFLFFSFAMYRYFDFHLVLTILLLGIIL